MERSVNSLQFRAKLDLFTVDEEAPEKEFRAIKNGQQDQTAVDSNQFRSKKKKHRKRGVAGSRKKRSHNHIAL